jgi:hypothetical protein
MTKTVSLIHPHETLKVSAQFLAQKCDLFSDTPTFAISHYSLKSQVSLSDFREFVSALEGAPVTITNNNFTGLSHLCDEFHFHDLAAQLSQFRKSGNLHAQTQTSIPLTAKSAVFEGAFTFRAKSATFECSLGQAVALSPAVCEQLSVDACARTFTLKDSSAVDSVRSLLSGNSDAAHQQQADLGRQLSNPSLELELNSNNFANLSVEALDEVLAGASVSIVSEDDVLEQLLNLGVEYHPLLRRIEIRFLSASGLAALAEYLAVPPEWIWGAVADLLIDPPPSKRAAIVPDPNPPPTGPLVASRVVREQRGGLIKHAKFTMVKNGQAILYAKVKGENCVPIGLTSDRTTPHIAVLKMSQHMKHFVLSDVEGMDLLEISFGLQEDSGKRGPRCTHLKMLRPIEGIPIEMTNVPARKDRWSGHWGVSGFPAATRASQKNCRFVDERYDTILMVFKTDAQTLGVEAHPVIPDQYTFAIGLAGFLTTA